MLASTSVWPPAPQAPPRPVFRWSSSQVWGLLPGWAGILGEVSRGPLRHTHSAVAPASGANSVPVRIESSSPSVTEGQTLDLNCAVMGLTYTQVTWYKRGGSLPPHAQVGGFFSLGLVLGMEAQAVDSL